MNTLSNSQHTLPLLQRALRASEDLNIYMDKINQKQTKNIRVQLTSRSWIKRLLFRYLEKDLTPNRPLRNKNKIKLTRARALSFELYTTLGLYEQEGSVSSARSLEQCIEKVHSFIN